MSSHVIKNEKTRLKSITPPREDKRQLKEKTPEGNENVLFFKNK
jgi:hypothetical protein